MKNKDTALEINTPNSKSPRADEVNIRTAAMQKRIPIMTNLHGTDAALKAITSLQRRGAEGGGTGAAGVQSVASQLTTQSILKSSMKTLLTALFALASLVNVTSCTLTAKAYPVAGPAVQGGKVLDARFKWSGSGSGTVELTLPDGEVCTGRYATVVGGVMSPEIVAEQGSAVAVSSAMISTGDVRGLQTSRAMLMGDRGTVVDFEGYTSGASPTHGFGRAKDNKGNVWKVIW